MLVYRRLLHFNHQKACGRPLPAPRAARRRREGQPASHRRLDLDSLLAKRRRDEPQLGTQSIALSPGTVLTLEAVVEIVPTYTSDPFLGVINGIKDWTIKVISTTITESEPDYTSRSKAIVRHVVRFESAARPLQDRPLFSLVDFISTLGAQLGVLSIGIVLLAKWQSLTRCYFARKEQREARRGGRPSIAESRASNQRIVTPGEATSSEATFGAKMAVPDALPRPAAGNRRGGGGTDSEASSQSGEQDVAVGADIPTEPPSAPASVPRLRAAMLRNKSPAAVAQTPPAAVPTASAVTPFTVQAAADVKVVELDGGYVL